MSGLVPAPGYSGDRIEPAVELAEKGNIQYLAFECLAERTIAIAQQAKMTDPSKGYDPLLIDRMQAALPVCARNGVKLITNMGAANPVSAGEKTCRDRTLPWFEGPQDRHRHRR